MSRLDVWKSLLRSGVRSASESLRNVPLATTLGRAVSDAGLARFAIRDAELTAAVARLAQVTAATVSCNQNRVRVDASYADGKHVALSLRPAGAMFAAGGAKELCFEVEPKEAAFDGASQEIVGALAAEIARTLWRPALARAPRSDQGGLATSESGRVVVDLRSVPEVRWAQRQRFPAAMIEAMSPRSLEIEPGRLLVRLSLERLLPRR